MEGKRQGIAVAGDGAAEEVVVVAAERGGFGGVLFGDGRPLLGQAGEFPEQIAVGAELGDVFFIDCGGADAAEIIADAAESFDHGGCGVAEWCGDFRREVGYRGLDAVESLAEAVGDVAAELFDDINLLVDNALALHEEGMERRDSIFYEREFLRLRMMRSPEGAAAPSSGENEF